MMLLEAWEGFETAQGEDENQANIASVKQKMPKRIKKKRLIQLDDGSNAGWEEYYDYIFPDDQKAASGLRILELAHKWKDKNFEMDDDSDDESDDDDSDEESGAEPMEV